jgi:hypothetical protein
MASEYPGAVIEFAGIDYPAHSDDLDERTRAVRDPAVVWFRVRTMGGRFRLPVVVSRAEVPPTMMVSEAANRLHRILEQAMRASELFLTGAPRP